MTDGHDVEVEDDPGARELVSGWTRNPVTASHVVRPSSPDELAMAVKAAGRRGAIAPVSYTHLTLPTNREV